METLYTLQEVTEAWKISDKTIVRLVGKGEIEGIKIGTDWRFSKDTLENYLSRRTISNNKKKSLTLK